MLSSSLGQTQELGHKVKCTYVGLGRGLGSNSDGDEACWVTVMAKCDGQDTMPCSMAPDPAPKRLQAPWSASPTLLAGPGSQPHFVTLRMWASLHLFICKVEEVRPLLTVSIRITWDDVWLEVLPEKVLPTGSLSSSSSPPSSEATVLLVHSSSSFLSYFPGMFFLSLFFLC